MYCIILFETHIFVQQVVKLWPDKYYKLTLK